jgi:hypothetical protein
MRRCWRRFPGRTLGKRVCAALGPLGLPASCARQSGSRQLAMVGCCAGSQHMQGNCST